MQGFVCLCYFSSVIYSIRHNDDLWNVWKSNSLEAGYARFYALRKCRSVTTMAVLWIWRIVWLFGAIWDTLTWIWSSYKAWYMLQMLYFGKHNGMLIRTTLKSKVSEIPGTFCWNSVHCCWCELMPKHCWTRPVINPTRSGAKEKGYFSIEQHRLHLLM